MKKKTVLLSSLFLTAGIATSVIAFLGKGNSFVKAESEDWEDYQITFTKEDSSFESSSTYTTYFKLHQDCATRSGYPIDSTPEKCFIMADDYTGVDNYTICYARANPANSTNVSLVVTIPLKNIRSFTNAIFRGKFYPSIGLDYVSEIEFGSESFWTDKLEVDVSDKYKFKEIILEEIEINYTCA